MGEVAVGTVILVNFPFSDLTHSKQRPAVVLAKAGRGDWVLCQITSRPYGDPLAVVLETGDFESGSLPLTSYARPGKLFTANESLLGKAVGRLNLNSHLRVVDAIVGLIRPATQ